MTIEYFEGRWHVALVRGRFDLAMNFAVAHSRQLMKHRRYEHALRDRLSPLAHFRVLGWCLPVASAEECQPTEPSAGVAAAGCLSTSSLLNV